MEQKYSLWQRIISDTPAFFVWLQRLGLCLIALSAELSNLHYLPATWCTAMVSVGSTLAMVSQFAVKQCEPLKPVSYDDPEQHRAATH